MNTHLKLILCGILALLVGLAFSIPLLASSLKPRTTIELIVDVKYAYFEDQTFNQNISGLWRNASNPLSFLQHLVSYIIILNVTNHSDKVANVDEFEVVAAPEILTRNGTVTGIFDAVVDDVRTIQYYPGWDQYWMPDQSRLVALTGTVGAFQTIFNSLINGTIYLYGRVRAMAYGSGMYSQGFGLRLVHLQQYGRDFLYNALISGNQLLQISNGFDVSILSGS